jgi:hypothetical protein
MPSARPGALRRRLALVAFLCAFAAPSAARAGDVVLYRVFLLDGTTAVSYGEYARSAGDVVLTVPIGPVDAGTPALRLVSLPETLIDWPRTEAYAEAARAKQFADTRGEAEFARLGDRVAGTLSEIAYTEAPLERLALAERARQMLAAWPGEHFGYRAGEVAQLAGVLDDVVSELRVAAGQSRFDLSLVGTAVPPPAVPILPPPTLRESVEQAFALTRVSQNPPQRAALLRSIIDALAGPAGSEAWAAALRARATADLRLSTRIDRQYADLTARTLAEAGKKLRRADIRGIEGLIKDVLKADDTLGRQRPQETAALLATMDMRLDAARRFRLASDRFALRARIVRSYEKKTGSAFDALGDAREPLERIRELSGPSPKALRKLLQKTLVASRELALIKPAPEVDAVHGILASAFEMAIRAANDRMAAIRGNDMTVAWRASSAAAGALLLFDRARDEIRTLMVPPTP